MKIWHPNKVFLKPGELYMSEMPTLVTTLLGSCVTVTMFNARRKIGAICHGLLPECANEDQCDCAGSEHLRYVDCAIRCMVKKFSSYGIEPDEIDGKLFGGADMFKLNGHRETVGTLNIQKARQVMEAEGVPLIACDVGGSQGRQLYFYSHTGEVLLKKLSKIEYDLPDPGTRGRRQG